MTAANSNPVQKTDETFVLTREIDAPRELVYKAWTDANALEQWWGPEGMALGVKKLDIRPGGMFIYSMTAGSDVMWGRFIYREIEEPGRMVFVDSFSDSEGAITRAPFSETWPLEMVSTLTLEERNGKTYMNLQIIPENATAEERQTFKEGHDSMKQGWGGTMDQLVGYLARMQQKQVAK